MSGSIDSRDVYTFDEHYEKLLGMDLNGAGSRSRGVKNAIPLKELLSLDGKTAIVTGGARGLGLNVVNRLAEAGAKVVIVDLAMEFAEAAIAFFATKGYSVKFFKADIRDTAQIQAAVDFAVKEFGSLDILANIAGVWHIGEFFDLTEEQWSFCVDVTLKGTVFFTQIAAKQMVKQGTGGRIVNATSLGSYSMESYEGRLAPYVAAKAGVLAVSRSLTRELKPKGVHINVVCPGGMATAGGAHMSMSGKIPPEIRAMKDSFPSVPVGDPDEPARIIYIMCTEMASYMDGSDVLVDGGTRWCLTE